MQDKLGGILPDTWDLSKNISQCQEIAVPQYQNSRFRGYEKASSKFLTTRFPHTKRSTWAKMLALIKKARVTSNEGYWIRAEGKII